MTSKQPARKRASRPEAEAPAAAGAAESEGAERDGESRWRRTAIAAYFRAQARGFAPGRELEDWLEAEREIDSLDAARNESARSQPAAAASAEAPFEATAPARKRASSRRSRSTKEASLQARNRGDAS